MTRSKRLLDLCAGIGGFSLAAHWLGWQTEAFCERDKFCQKVLTKNFPGVSIYDDVFTFPSESFRGRIDVLTAGFPCQPFSAAGKRKGRDDERHIFPAILDIVGKVQPTWCVFENVRGLLSIESGQVYAEIITSLESEGFEVITHCVPASALNAPHRRDRLWIVAYSHTNRVTRQSQQDVEPSTRIEPPQRYNASRFNAPHPNGLGECAGFGQVQGTDGEVSERHDNAEFSNADFCVATDTINKRRVRRGEQGQGGERAIHSGCGNDRAFSESQFDSQFVATDPDATIPGGLRERTEAKHARYCGRNSGTANANREGLQGSDEGTHRAGQSKAGFGLRDRDAWSEPWIDVAARTCVRGMDDGLPDELHITGSRDNRVNRLKALGNSIVPQIAYELFKAIDAAEKKVDLVHFPC